MVRRKAFQDKAEDRLSDEEYEARMDHFARWNNEFLKKDEELRMIDGIREMGEALERIEAMESQQSNESRYVRDDNESEPSDETTPDDNNDTDKMRDVSSETEPDALTKARAVVEYNDFLLKTAIFDIKREFREKALLFLVKERLRELQEQEDDKTAADDKTAEPDQILCYVKIRRRRLRARNRLGWDVYEKKGGYRVQIVGQLVDEIEKVIRKDGWHYRAFKKALLGVRRRFVVRRNAVRRRMMMLCAIR